MVLECTINGEPAEVLVQPYHTLLEALRETTGLTGAKEGCGTGDCGACTVHLDGKPVGELPGAGDAGPRAERPHHRGAGRGGRLAAPGPGRVREARRPAVRLLHPGHDHVGRARCWRRTRPRPRRRSASGSPGNLCRCTGYTKMVAAIAEARGRPARGRRAERWQP